MTNTNFFKMFVVLFITGAFGFAGCGSSSSSSPGGSTDVSGSWDLYMQKDGDVAESHMLKWILQKKSR